MTNSFNHAILLKPEDSSVFESIGDGYRRVKAYDEALKAYREAVRLQPNKPELWLSIAGTHAALHQNGQAITSLQEAERAIKTWPGVERPKVVDALRWLQIGELYGDLHKYEDARRALLEAIRLDPEHRDLYRQTLQTFP